MTLAKAEREARNLMDDFGLELWKFAFDRGTRRLGATHPRDKKITLSKKFVEKNKWEEVKQTILHEIAHAVTGEGHTNKWRKFFAEIGGWVGGLWFLMKKSVVSGKKNGRTSLIA